jgi:uncharacterized protein YndB with AHSA1/START domain
MIGADQPGWPDGIRLVRLIPASPAEVYRAFLDPDVLARWFGPAQFTVLDARIEPWKGGTHRTHVAGPGGVQGWFDCTILDLIPDRKLVLAWSWVPEDAHEPEPQRGSTLSILLRPVPGAATELTLLHERLGGAPHEDPAGIKDRWAEAIWKLADLYHRASAAHSSGAHPFAAHSEEDGALRLRRILPAAPDRVFAAWTVPAMMSRWLFVGPTSRIISTTVDLRVGGRFSILERPDGFEDVDHVGEYLDVQPPHRLAFSLEVPAHFPGRTEIRLGISAVSAGSELTFTQHGVDPQTVRSSWEMMFDTLEGTCASATSA